MRKLAMHGTFTHLNVQDQRRPDPVMAIIPSRGASTVLCGERKQFWRNGAAMTEAKNNEQDRLHRLLRAVADDRDRVAFKELFAHFAPRLKSYLQRGGAAPQVAEDVTQEAMINVWRKAAHFDPAKAAASTWIFTIARNARIDHLRRQNRPEPDVNDPAFLQQPEPSPIERISQEQEAARLRAAVARLPDEQQAVLKLAFFEDKAHAAIATELALPLGTVKSRIRLALKRIRSVFEELE